MAQKRMFSKIITDSDLFMDMPASTQALYFHLGMAGDDDGFVDSPRRIQRALGASNDDLRMLITKKFVIPFDSGVVVIRHWNVHNSIRKDRKKDTVHQAEKQMITSDPTGVYLLKTLAESQSPGSCQPTDNQVATNCPPSIDQVSIDQKEREAPKGKIPPSIEEVKEYISDKGYSVNAEQWFDFYESKGWRIGTGKMKNWKAAVRTWERRDKSKTESTEKQVVDDGGWNYGGVTLNERS